ncbi:MAG: alpha-amylase family glycosyl hydrolase, partial [Rhodothermales bacterium]|nr:alpha-amylase family glycosyl hydrolase [Rhodothermales bacterium]
MMVRLPALLLFSAFLLAACEPSAGVEEPAAPEAPAALTWQQPGWVDDAVIYELFTTDFTEEGTFRAIIPRLGELEDLGVNTIWLMPIHPIGEEGRKGVLGSPYAIKDYYAVNPAFGTEEDFRALVDSVHARGMHLLIDLVANHTAPDNAWVDEHPEWYTRDADGNPITPVGPDGNPTDWTDVVDLNYDDPALRAEMIRMMRYWVEEFDIDGYRADVAGWVPDAFWEEAIAALRAVKPVLMLAENEEPSIHRAGFDLTYAWPEYARLKEVWSGAPASSLVALVEEVEAALPEGAGRLRFTTNHDETAWDAPPPDLFGGQQGAQAAYVLTASLPGAPLVYNGQETGVETPVPFFEKSAYDWTARPEVRAFYDAYLALHEASPALQDGALTFHAADAEDAV